eukprot:TRINITY_DN2226_c0_g2_i1.p1 TRINITY_DN2226_c0_g2~~TRINITY_DN2226_c0_g2_i1.p1  ORF type:complete len:442 (+),score=59.25 TRINITY_DN2226_c0_g2_i1:58-1383(+)
MMRRASTSASQDYRMLFCGGKLTLEKIAQLMHLKSIYKPDITVCSEGLVGEGPEYIDKGKMIVTAMNAAGVDIVGVSDCDRRWGNATLTQRVHQFAGKVLSATDMPGISGLYKYTREEINKHNKFSLTSVSSLSPESITELRAVADKFRDGITIPLSTAPVESTVKLGTHLLSDLKGTIPMILATGGDDEARLSSGVRVVQSDEQVVIVDIWNTEKSTHMVTKQKLLSTMNPDLENLSIAHKRMINGILDSRLPWLNEEHSTKGVKKLLHPFMVRVASQLRDIAKVDLVLLHQGMFVDNPELFKEALTPRYIQENIMPYPSQMVTINVTVEKINDILTWKARREVEALEIGTAGKADILVADDHWYSRFPLQSAVTGNVLSDNTQRFKVLVPKSLTEGSYLFRALKGIELAPSGTNISAMNLLMSGLYDTRVQAATSAAAA